MMRGTCLLAAMFLAGSAAFAQADYPYAPAPWGYPADPGMVQPVYPYYPAYYPYYMPEPAVYAPPAYQTFGPLTLDKTQPILWPDRTGPSQYTTTTSAKPVEKQKPAKSLKFWTAFKRTK
jgi:hypothetical protein